VLDPGRRFRPRRLALDRSEFLNPLSFHGLILQKGLAPSRASPLTGWAAEYWRVGLFRAAGISAWTIVPAWDGR
jgi:hypothetical protein